MRIKNMKQNLVKNQELWVQTMRYDVDGLGRVRGLYTLLQETSEGMVMSDGPERFGQLI